MSEEMVSNKHFFFDKCKKEMVNVANAEKYRILSDCGRLPENTRIKKDIPISGSYTSIGSINSLPDTSRDERRRCTLYP